MNATGFINSRRDLWVMRLYYLIWLGGGGSIGPFMNLFLVRQNLSGTQIGLMVALGSAAALVAAPFWTRLSAQNSRPLRLLQISLVLLALANLLMVSQSVFLVLTVVFILRVLVSAGITPLSDSLAVRVSEAAGAGFGSIRVWGSLGWAFFVLGTGALVERAGIQITFWVHAAALSGAALLLFGLRPAGAARTERKTSLPWRQVAGTMLRSPVLVGLGVMLCINGLANNGVGQFENVYLDQLGARESIIGVANMVGSVIELPGMLWADSLLRKRNPGTLLLVSVVMTGLLRGLVFFWPSVETIILARAITGISFSFYTIALIKTICGEAPAEGTATALAIFTVTLPSLINILGTPLAGMAFDAVGAHWLYLVALVGYLLGSAALGLGLWKRRQQKQEVIPA